MKEIKSNSKLRVKEDRRTLNKEEKKECVDKQGKGRREKGKLREWNSGREGTKRARGETKEMKQRPNEQEAGKLNQ